MSEKNLQLAKQLRHTLHECAELSGFEKETKKTLMEFLKTHTSLEVVDCKDWFYAKHMEDNPSKTSIAIRGDYDALATPSGKACHLCGHDGHAATLCYLALEMEGRTFDRNVFLIFQPEEETGQGAKKCCEIFKMEKIDEVYGLHNLPGKQFQQVTSKYGTFACASKGVTISLFGKPTHAAYPELGISPAYVTGEFLVKLKELGDPSLYKGMTLCTVIGVHMGEKAFGAAAQNSEIYLTMRGEYDEDLEKLYETSISYITKLAKENHLEIKVDVQDVFPSVQNSKECVDKVLALNDGVFLDVPMRWSEDFGHYLHYCKGAFYGIGAGVDYPGLHTENYEYNDELLEPSMQSFLKIVED